MFVIIGLSALSSITSGAISIVIQKDWVVVLFGQNKDRLAVVNFWIRAIELGWRILIIFQTISFLGTKIVIPSIAGIMMSKIDYVLMAGIQAGIIGSVGILQLGLLKWIYQQSRSLSMEKPFCERESLSMKMNHLLKGSKQFFRHKVSLPGISLAMLYLTVLGFDSITIR